MTYYDAGETQVFNSLWYPRIEHGDLPLLGIDLIQFRDRFLVVVDFQPLDEKKELTDLKKLWEEMPLVLRGRMSQRFYDEDRFFSDHMLFGRFSSEEALEDGLVDVGGELWVAVQKYVALHMEMVMEQKQAAGGIAKENRIFRNDDAPHVLERQREYDIYSAERDPAHAMFVKMFGKEFADGYVYDFLFSLSGGGDGV